MLITVLQRYGFTDHLAVIITVLFLLINTPLMRTLGFIQVNLLTLDLILLSLVVYPKHAFLSALALAFAVHLKTSPAVLVLAFLLEFNWRWLFWFAVSFIAIGLFPVLTNGVSLYQQFLTNTFLATLGHDWPWSYWLPIGMLAVTFFTRAGRALGVDAYLLKRFGERGWLLW